MDMPVLNVFRMFSRMGGRKLSVTSDGAVPLDNMLKRGVREKPDVSAQASRDGNKLSILAWHYHDDDLPGANADVTLEFAGLPSSMKGARVKRYVIDAEHSNSYEVWKKMGSPQKPPPQQYAELEKSGKLAELSSAEQIKIGESGVGSVTFKLPRQAVTLLVIER